MNAKTSCFNKKIYTQNLIQGIPFILLMTAFLLLFIVSAINTELSYFEYENFSKSTCNERLQYTLYTYSCDGGVKAFMSCYSFLCGIFVFRYLYNKKLCGTIHSLPLTRTNLFVSNTLSGLTLLAAPFIITAVILSVYMLILGYSISHIPLWIVVMAGYCLIFYALAVLTAMLTGHLVSAPIIYCFLNFGFLIAQVLLQALISVFYFGMDVEINTNFFILTPFAYLLEHLHAPTLAPAYNETVVVAFAKNGIKGIIIYAIVSVIILAVSLFLYQKRKLETQGDPVVTKKLEPVLLYIATALCGAVMTIILFAIFFYNYNSYYMDTASMAAIIILFLICSVIAYFILTMLLKKTVRVFKGKHKGLIAYIGVMLLIILIVRLDLLNIEGKVPEAGDVASVEIYYDGYHSSFENKETIENITALHKAIIDKKAILVEEANNSYNSDMEYFRGISIEYQLKNGKTLNRYYYIVGAQPLKDEVCKILNGWDDFINSETTMLDDLEKTKDHITDISVTIAEGYEEHTTTTLHGTETVTTAVESFSLSKGDFDTLLEAIEKDIKDGTLKNEAYYTEENSNTLYYIYVDSYKEDDYDYKDYSRNYRVTDSSTNTKVVIETFMLEESKAIQEELAAEENE